MTPQAPGVTDRSKSFEVSVSSVSSKLEGLVLSLGDPSAVCGNLCPLVRFMPQVQVSKSRPTHPRFAVYAPTAFPYGRRDKFVTNLLTDSSPLVLIVRPIGSLFLTLPCPVAAISTDAYRSSFEIALVAIYTPALALYRIVPA